MASKINMLLVTWLLVFILVEESKPVLARRGGKLKGLEKRVTSLEKQVAKEDECKACSLIDELFERVEALENRTSPIAPPVPEECQNALGMENGAIPDASISASSEWDANHAAKQSRLNFQAVTGKAGSWSASVNDPNQWLQVDLGNQHTEVTGVATQGRNAFSQWVTEYKLQFSDDGVNFFYYKEQGQSAPKVFAANTDSDTVVYHELAQTVNARYIRIRPTAWHGHISMRLELYGCKRG